MKYYEFRSKWIPISTPPLSGDRCIVTDGEYVTIATYIKDGDSSHWMYSDAVDGAWPHVVIGWMPTPKPMVLPISSLNSTSSKD